MSMCQLSQLFNQGLGLQWFHPLIQRFSVWRSLVYLGPECVEVPGLSRSKLVSEKTGSLHPDKVVPVPLVPVPLPPVPGRGWGHVGVYCLLVIDLPDQLKPNRIPPQTLTHLLTGARRDALRDVTQEVRFGSGGRAGLLVTRRSLVRSPAPPSSCRGVPERDASPRPFLTSWLSPCVADSAVSV